MKTIISIRKTLQSMSHNQLIPLPLLLNRKMELRNNYPSAKREIELVTLAINLDIIQEMLRLKQSGMHVEYLLPKLIRWMSLDINMNDTEAKWAVHSWAMAFGFIPFSDEILLPVDR